jgi:hypothetical protein
MLALAVLPPGFQEEFGSIKEFLEACKKDVTMMPQFKAARKHVLKMINDGKLPLRLRGSKKAAVLEVCQGIRSSVVDMIKSSFSQDFGFLEVGGVAIRASEF